MHHLDISPLGLIVSGIVGSLLMWAPVFAFAYWRRPFGGRARNYALAWLGVSIGFVAVLSGMAVLEG